MPTPTIVNSIMPIVVYAPLQLLQGRLHGLGNSRKAQACASQNAAAKALFSANRRSFFAGKTMSAK